MEKENSKLIFSLISLAVFFFLLMGIVVAGGFQVDTLVNQKISLLQNSFLDKIFNFLGIYLKRILIVLGAISISALYLGKRKIESLVLAVSLVSGYLFEQIVKFIIQRPRPGGSLFQESVYGFPSGHSIFAAILFLSLIYFYKDRIKNNFLKKSFILINLLLILFVGFSRIYIDAHWFTDVVGGYAAGFLVTVVVLWVFSEKILEEF